MYSVKNVFHHGLIEMQHVHYVEQNYRLHKSIIEMVLHQDISFGTKTFI